MHILLLMIFAIALPPAAKTLIVIGSVYAIMAAAKANTSIAKFLNGWVAVVVNIILTALGLLLAIPASDLYSLNTFTSVVVGVLGASGIHGMVKSFASPKEPTPVKGSFDNIASEPKAYEPISKFDSEPKVSKFDSEPKAYESTKPKE